MAKNDDINKEYLSELAQELQKSGQREQAEKQNIKMMLYPSLAGFALLAVYGFYLIQSLTTDIDAMSESVITMNQSISRNMESISVTAENMSQGMGKMIGNIHSMSLSTKGITSNMGDMTLLVQELQLPMDDMNASTHNIQLDVHGLNQNISKPMGMFNGFIP